MCTRLPVVCSAWKCVYPSSLRCLDVQEVSAGAVVSAAAVMAAGASNGASKSTRDMREMPDPLKHYFSGGGVYRWVQHTTAAAEEDLSDVDDGAEATNTATTATSATTR